jgi:hypothetical protein
MRASTGTIAGIVMFVASTTGCAHDPQPLPPATYHVTTAAEAEVAGRRAGCAQQMVRLSDSATASTENAISDWLGRAPSPVTRCTEAATPTGYHCYLAAHDVQAYDLCDQVDKTAAATATTPTASPPPLSPPPVVVTSVGPATPVEPAKASFADPLIQAMAVVDARGFWPDGSAFAAQFQQGQTLEQTFNAVPGKCYVAFGVGQGITQLDITASTISPSPMIPSVIVATSTTSGPVASIGGGGACVRFPLPVGGPFKITLRATSGSGIAVGRIFSR